MSALANAFMSRKSFLHGKGVMPEQIAEVEKQLGLSFSDEYREYLTAYGIVAYDGHELTGITKSNRLNVVAVTTEARKKQPGIPDNFYVIEEVGIEELIIMQNEQGEIYGCAPNYKPKKICDSLHDYVSK